MISLSGPTAIGTATGKAAETKTDTTETATNITERVRSTTERVSTMKGAAVPPTKLRTTTGSRITHLMAAMITPSDPDILLYGLSRGHQGTADGMGVRQRGQPQGRQGAQQQPTAVRHCHADYPALPQPVPLADLQEGLM